MTSKDILLHNLFNLQDISDIFGVTSEIKTSGQYSIHSILSLKHITLSFLNIASCSSPIQTTQYIYCLDEQQFQSITRTWMWNMTTLIIIRMIALYSLYMWSKLRVCLRAASIHSTSLHIRHVIHEIPKTDASIGVLTLKVMWKRCTALELTHTVISMRIFKYFVNISV